MSSEILNLRIAFSLASAHSIPYSIQEAGKALILCIQPMSQRQELYVHRRFVVRFFLLASCLNHLRPWPFTRHVDPAAGPVKLPRPFPCGSLGLSLDRVATPLSARFLSVP